jgi:hypothetical protein
MLPFFREAKDDSSAPAPAAVPAHPLDALTGGVFSAATSGERAQRLRVWLAGGPAHEQMQEVFKELSAKDKGAARPLREKLDEIKRAGQQDAVAHAWADKGQALLAAARLNIADALAWQRDAARAGAPLSREPLSSLRASLTERVKAVEDLQQRLMVQREAAVLLAQRIEMLSTKSWADAQAAHAGLQADVAHWRAQAGELALDAHWPSVDMRYSSQLQAAQIQLDAVWEAFAAALAQAQAAARDAAAPLPAVPAWAEELRAARGEPAAAQVEKPAKPKFDPEQRAAAHKAVEAGAMLLEQAVAAGHTRNMHSAVNALRQSLKAHGRLIDDALEARVHAALVSAGELEGWQRWSADKLREQLVARAEALLVKRKIKGAAAEGEAMIAGQAVDRFSETQTEAPAAESVAASESEAAAAQPTDEAALEEAVAESVAEGITDSPAQEPLVIPAQAGIHAAHPSSGDNQGPMDSDSRLRGNNEGGKQAGEGVTEESAPAAEPDGQPAPVAGKAPKAELSPSYELAPAMGARKLQEAIRKLREEWKTADQGGPPNHALWKRFDRAVNAAHQFVDAWIVGARAETAEHKAQRQALIDEINTWAAAYADAGAGGDWKAVNRQIHQFSERWRNAGHLSEKQFAEMQPRWKEAIHAAALPLETMQKASVERRRTLIAQAEELSAAPRLSIDAVRDLQARWQAEAQAVPLERKHEQKLWDAFRKPIDEAFHRKGAEREAQRASLTAHDRAVLEAAKALEAANAGGDAQQIRAAMTQLEAAMRGQVAPAAGLEQNTLQTKVQSGDTAPEKQAPPASAEGAVAAPAEAAPAEGTGAGGDEAGSESAPAAAAAPPAAAPKPVIAVRGDDRPGAKKDMLAGRDGRERRDGREGRGGRPGERGARSGERGARGFGDARGPREFGEKRGPREFGEGRGPHGMGEARGPRLGDAAFRAQREALEHAQAALKKLSAQAHGQALTQLIDAWAARQPQQLPSAQELGRAVTGGVRGAWAQALQSAPQAGAGEALLRLEMAAGVPTPADHLQERRALQLQLLTRRNEPGPRETWTGDAARVLAAAHDEAAARRLQNALKALLE